MFDYTQQSIYGLFWTWTNVETGAADVAEEDAATGGWYIAFEREMLRKRRRVRELEEAEEEQERIQDAMDREIARLLQDQERKDAERKDLERIRSIVKRYESVSPVEVDSERVLQALKAAQLKQSKANLERLQREFERMTEEEDFMAMLMMLANE